MLKELKLVGDTHKKKKKKKKKGRLLGIIYKYITGSQYYSLVKLFG
jgi:hypothetical protein